MANKFPKDFFRNKGNKSKGFMPIDLELEQGEDGYYRIVTAYSKSAKSVEGILLFEDSTHSSSATATDSLPRLTDDKSGVRDHRANITGRARQQAKYSLDASDNEIIT